MGQKVNRFCLTFRTHPGYAPRSRFLPDFAKGAFMARVTVEDCIEKVPNRFELVLLAGQRARQISGGAEITLERDRDKNPVVALREIAEATVSPDALVDRIITDLQKVHIDEDDVADELGSLAQSAEALRLTAAAPPRNQNLGPDYE